MQKRSLVWVSALVCLFYVSQMTLLPVFAADAPKAVGGDVGEAIHAPEPEKEAGILPWILGAVAAGLGGWIIADQTADEDSADDAEAAAAAAAAAATTAEAAATAAQTETTAEAGIDYHVFITGTFAGSATTYNGGPSFNPSISFSVSDLDTHPGGINNYISSATAGWTAQGGKYEQVSNSSVLVLIDDPFYIGLAVVLSETKIKLANGTILTAQAGAKAYLIKK